MELENLLHFLSTVLCGSGGEKKGTRTSAPKISGVNGGGEEFSVWGGVGKIQRRSVLKRMWDKRREKGRKVEKNIFPTASWPLFLLSLYLYLSLPLTILDSCANA